MLQIQGIYKQYKTGDLIQTALNNVSLNLRDNEFVAILGPSGSGKTTLLNIIGGLDRYDSGDLIINGISTKKYRDRDWDSYRNHTIGFVFQSYNLIPHQSVLSNVEMALTISGVSRKERKRRAKEALEKVGLGEQIHKRPNQMSGGQMQRVAIARALVNDPDIVLADEPTGALDTETSIQVMELLKEVAKDRLVVMVTHNPELAESYANRIVRLRDGVIQNDSNPYEVKPETLTPPEHKNMGKASMSFLTSLSLSFNNLRTKKGRTILTAFAGSIGIIGISLILSLSNGVNNYITDIQKDTMSSYPIAIEDKTIDLSGMMNTQMGITAGAVEQEKSHGKDAVYANNSDLEATSDMLTSLKENNLTDFKKYLEDKDSDIQKHIGENGVVYSYDTKFDIYTYDSENALVNTDGSTLESVDAQAQSGGMSMSMGSTEANNFDELIPGGNGEAVSSALTDNYEVVYGTWPSKYNEVVLVLDKNNEISATTLYQLGMLPTSEYQKLMKQAEAGEKIKLDEKSFSYEDICKQLYYLIPACDSYQENENGVYEKIDRTSDKFQGIMSQSLQLKIVGIVRADGDEDTTFINTPIGYTNALTSYLIDYTNKSAVVQEQEASPEKNVLNGMDFATKENANADASAMEQQTTNVAGTYEDNLSEFGVVSLDAPSTISIYVDSFEDKEAIAKCIEEYNRDKEEEDQITYTDYVGLVMSSVTTIINVITYILVAFVAVSLIVSSIMIGIITFISVLERTKEIGILRALGASKHNITQVFNAETFIIGLLSGLIGNGVTLLLLVPINAIIHAVTQTDTVNASLPLGSACILIGLSVLLTLIGGLIPSKKAAKKDPVTALRTE